jgi:ribosomal protein S17E
MRAPQAPRAPLCPSSARRPVPSTPALSCSSHSCCAVAFYAVQGRVRTKTIKRSARVVVEKYYPKLGLDFHNNKRVVDDVAQLPSKRMRNKIAGFITVRAFWVAVAHPRLPPTTTVGG